ncbi:DUF6387 family protein [Erwinia aphidicola]|uniref:DUF6387 family protein n=1 Tax=Erwinia aphidicola TaxID=68334 RepID=UPI0030192956
MKKKLEDIYSEVLEWFDLKNYTAFENVSLETLNKEMFIRKEFHESVSLFGFAHSKENEMELILTGKTILSNIINIENKTYNKSDVLNEVTFSNIAKIERHLKQYTENVYQDSGKMKPEKMKLPISILLKESIFKSNKTEVFISFDINKSTDDEIIASLSHKLKKLRTQHKTSKPQSIEKYGPSKTKKILEFRIMALVDLLIWANLQGFTMPNAVIARVLYPHESLILRGEDNIKDTDRPMADRILSGETGRSLEHYINKNREFRDILLKDHMSLK